MMPSLETDRLRPCLRLLGAISFACAAFSRRADGQVLAYKYMYNDAVQVDTASVAWANFRPVGPSGGRPQSCLAWSPKLVGLPDNVLFAPRWEERKSELYLWFHPSKARSHAQVIRHESTLPLRDPADTNNLDADPFTSRTRHTVLLVDWGDSTIVAYNRTAGSPERGVFASLSAVRNVPWVREALDQLEEAVVMCAKTALQTKKGTSALRLP